MGEPLHFLYPSSVFITVMSLVSSLGISLFGVLEILGIHLQYSKLWNANSRRIRVSSTAGMFLLYAPASLFAFASFVIFRENDFRSRLVAFALAIHFFKRVLEVCSSLLYYAFSSFAFPLIFVSLEKIQLHNGLQKFLKILVPPPSFFFF